MNSVALFVEDEAHRALLEALVQRVAAEEGVEVQTHVRNAQGGSGMARIALRKYMKDVAAGLEHFIEILVVGIDCDCGRWQDVRREIQQLVRDGFAGAAVVAAPSPHIERWYLADPRAPARSIGEDYVAQVPPDRCERDRFKKALRKAFLQGGVDPPARGIVLAGDIVSCMDLAEATRLPDLAAFLEDLRAALRIAAADS